MERYLENGDVVYTTGVYLIYRDGKFEVQEIDGDTFFDGDLVNDLDSRPYTDEEDRGRIICIM